MNREMYMKSRGLPAAKRIRSEIAATLGKIQMRQLEEELSEQFGRPLLEQIADDIDAAFGFGMEEAQYRAVESKADWVSYRKELMVKAFFSDTAKSMPSEQRELYALRAFAGIEKLDLKDTD